jgi:FtsH-binding integral membrane protein
MGTYVPPQTVPYAAAQEARAAFITRTYLHLLGAVLAFVGIEAWLFTSGLAADIATSLLGVNWLWVIGGFVVVSWLASRVAHGASSPVAQYLALTGFVVAEAIIFVPLLFVAQAVAPGTIESAALITAVAFTALTGIVFATRQDFSFLRSIVMWGMLVALLVIVAGAIFGFQLGTFFSVAMVGIAGAAILYDTSNVLHHFPEDRHVGAALELFASVALMLWYVLRLLISLRD